jgi:hypothetical protein
LPFNPKNFTIVKTPHWENYKEKPDSAHPEEQPDNWGALYKTIDSLSLAHSWSDYLGFLKNFENKISPNLKSKFDQRFILQIYKTMSGGVKMIAIGGCGYLVYTLLG